MAVDRELHRVRLLIRKDDAVRERHVPAHERAPGRLDHLVDLASHGEELFAQSLELRLELLARGMVSGALDALVTEDVARAQQLIAKDEVVDNLSARTFEEVLSRMRVAPQNAYRATRIQSISRYIERIADHGVNIAERVIFVLTGEDIRHRPRTRHPIIS